HPAGGPGRRWLTWRRRQLHATGCQSDSGAKNWADVSPNRPLVYFALFDGAPQCPEAGGGRPAGAAPGHATPLLRYSATWHGACIRLAGGGQAATQGRRAAAGSARARAGGGEHHLAATPPRPAGAIMAAAGAAGARPAAPNRAGGARAAGPLH